MCDDVTTGLAAALWDSIEGDSGIEGILSRADCDYLAGVAVAHLRGHGQDDSATHGGGGTVQGRLVTGRDRDVAHYLVGEAMKEMRSVFRVSDTGGVVVSHSAVFNAFRTWEQVVGSVGRSDTGYAFAADVFGTVAARYEQNPPEDVFVSAVEAELRDVVNGTVRTGEKGVVGA